METNDLIKITDMNIYNSSEVSLIKRIKIFLIVKENSATHYNLLPSNKYNKKIMKNSTMQETIISKPNQKPPIKLIKY